MLSFAYPPYKTIWKKIKESGYEVMIDSGAYTAWKQGKNIDIDAYMQYIKEHQIKHYFNLDVVKNAEATANNQKIMEAAGFNPIPVFHIGEPFKILDELVIKYSLIGLGGTVGKSLTIRKEWFREVFTRYPNHKFHGLGIAHPDLLRFPFYSIDTTWWIFKAGPRDMVIVDGNRQNEQLARIRRISKEKDVCYQTVMF